MGISIHQYTFINLHHKLQMFCPLIFALCLSMGLRLSPWFSSIAFLSWPYFSYSFSLVLVTGVVNIKFWVVITNRSNLAYQFWSMGRSCLLRRVLRSEQCLVGGCCDQLVMSTTGMDLGSTHATCLFSWPSVSSTLFDPDLFLCHPTSVWYLDTESFLFIWIQLILCIVV